MAIDADYLKSRIKEVREAIDELKRLTSKPFAEMGLDEKYSMRYQVVVLAEALGSICIHIAAEDMGREPESSAECFKLLEAHGLTEFRDDLVKIARLRNLLVHRYWTIDDAKVYEAIRGNFKCVDDLLERVGKRYGI